MRVRLACLLSLAFAAAALNGASAYAAGDQAAGEMPKGLACEFAQGVSGSYSRGAFTTKTPSAIKLSIENINLAQQSASFHAEGSSANGKLAIARAIGANHFLEVATEGYWNITTIYDADVKTGLSPAIHSRHSGVLGQPQFAQYTGHCRPLP